MRHFIPALLIALSLFNPFKIFTKPATPTQRVSGSIVRLQTVVDSEQHSCTGFVIQPQVVLTAAHCVGNPMVIDGQTGTTLLKVDLYYDLAVYRVAILAKPSVSFRDVEVFRGEGVTAIGYAYGWDTLLVLAQTVAIPNYAVDAESATGIITQGGYVGGMSGGPVIDVDGFVVGIVQKSVGQTGYGVGSQFIKAFLHDTKIKTF